MELDDLKTIWLREKMELESKIILNHNLVKELIFNKSKNSFDKLIRISILGRNLALVYMLISLFLASTVLYELQYSIPAFIGAAAMLFSFFQHISLVKPDYLKMSTIELQKNISRFRVHTSKYSKYDISIVCIWFLTVLPICFKYFSKYFPFIFTQPIFIYCYFFLLIFLLIILPIFLYKKIDKELEESERQLDQIIEFEKD
jgi:hypothetical protein